MEVILLNQTNYVETGRFSNYETFAWNERFDKPGDFQLRCYSIEETLRIFHQHDVIGCSTSDTLMIVKKISVDLDQNGNDVATLTGSTLDDIFSDRPAAYTISDLDTQTANYPDGWQFGDELSEALEINPKHILAELFSRIDLEHYGREELSFLQLPFTYIDADIGFNTDVDTGGIPEGIRTIPEMLNYFHIDLGADSLGVIQELLTLSGMGCYILRPGSNPALLRQTGGALTPERPLAFALYRPINRTPVVVEYAYSNGANWVSPFNVLFDYNYEDAKSESSEQSVYRNVFIEQHEYGVATMYADEVVTNYDDLGDPPRANAGFLARVDLSEKEIEDISDYERTQVYPDFIKRAWEAYGESFSITMETDGNFPYHPKQFKFNSLDRNAYFLGDWVDVRAKGSTREEKMQVSEFVRTMDSNGYREYPIFKKTRKLGNYVSNYSNTLAQTIVEHIWD